MENNDSIKLLELSEQLIANFEKAILEAQKKEYDFGWKNPNAVQDTLLPNLKNLIQKYKDDIVMLAKFQVSLSKWLDYYYYDWDLGLKNSIDSTCRKIVRLSYNIIEQYLSNQTPTIVRCGCEDNACIYGNLGPRYSGPYLDNNGKWPELPEDQARNFLTTPQPIILKNTHIYRIIGITNNPMGSWWIFDYTLFNRAFWRSCFAVKEAWNRNYYYVDYRIPKEREIKVWIGPAANVQISSKCILPGGLNQIWISPKYSNKFNLHSPQEVKWPLDTQV